MSTDVISIESKSLWNVSIADFEINWRNVRKKRQNFAFFRKFSSHFVSKIFFSLDSVIKPFLFDKRIIYGQFKTISIQFEFIPFSLSSPPMRQFFRKISNDDYVIRDDVIGYPDKATDSNWPNEQSGITSFYELWDRKFGESLARVSLIHPLSTRK